MMPTMYISAHKYIYIYLFIYLVIYLHTHLCTCTVACVLTQCLKFTCICRPSSHPITLKIETLKCQLPEFISIKSMKPRRESQLSCTTISRSSSIADPSLHASKKKLYDITADHSLECIAAKLEPKHLGPKSQNCKTPSPTPPTPEPLRQATLNPDKVGRTLGPGPSHEIAAHATA